MRANLSGAKLVGADLSADMKNQSMGLMRAVLDSANLTGADLTGANMMRTRMKFAKMAGANLSGRESDAGRDGRRRPDRGDRDRRQFQ